MKNLDRNRRHQAKQSVFQRRILAALLVSASSYAVAQSNGGPRLEEVIVTAQLREQSLQEVPASVQAISSEDILDAGVGSMDSLVKIAPSISINKFLAPYQSSIRIRGVGTSVSAPTVESSVSMVVDGVVIARQAAFFTDLADIERIEILRGPQSTLFGKNAVAGAVNVTTKKPSLEEFSGMLEASYNDYGDLLTRGTVNGPLTDKVAASLTGTLTDGGDGIHENVFPGGPSLDDDDSWGVRGKLYWEPSDRVDWTLIADMREADGPNSVRTPVNFESDLVKDLHDIGPVDEDNRKISFNGGPFKKHFYDIEDSGLSLQGNFEVGDMVFTSITAYRNWDMESALDADQINTTVAPEEFKNFPPVIIEGVGPVEPGRFVLTGSTEVWGDLETSQFSQEFRLISPSEGNFRWLLGAFYWDTTLEFDNKQVLGLFNGANLAFNTIYDVDTTYWAVFGNADYDITERLTATFGLRYQEDEMDYKMKGGGEYGAAVVNSVDEIYADEGLAIRSVVPGFDGSDKVSNDEVTGKVALTYALNEEVNLFASFSRGYKGAGLEAPATARGFDTTPLLEETVDAYELGIKSRFLENRATLNVAFFWQEFENLQQRAYDTENAVLGAINAGETRQRGVEIDGLYYITDELKLSGGLVYLDAEYTDFDSAECFSPRELDLDCEYELVPGGLAVGSKDVSGEPVIYSPEWSYNIALDYRRPIGNLTGTARINYRFVDEQQGLSSQNPYTILDSYGVTDLRLGLETEDGKYSITGFVNNVFDESYGVYISGYNYSGQVNPNDITVTENIPKGAERSYGVTLRAHF